VCFVIYRAHYVGKEICVGLCHCYVTEGVFSVLTEGVKLGLLSCVRAAYVRRVVLVKRLPLTTTFSLCVTDAFTWRLTSAFGVKPLRLRTFALKLAAAMFAKVLDDSEKRIYALI
jgi:hypothetical protein